MRKLAFEHAGAGFEMPSLRMVDMETKNSNVMLATAKLPKTVYGGVDFSKAIALTAAADSEVLGLSTNTVVDRQATSSGSDE